MRPRGLPDTMPISRSCASTKVPGWQIAVESAELAGRNLSVRGLGTVFIENIEKHEAIGSSLRFLGHGYTLSLYVLLILFDVRLFGTCRLALRGFLFETFKLFLLFLRLGSGTVRALLVVIGFEGHFVRSLFEAT